MVHTEESVKENVSPIVGAWIWAVDNSVPDVLLQNGSQESGILRVVNVPFSAVSIPDFVLVGISDTAPGVSFEGILFNSFNNGLYTVNFGLRYQQNVKNPNDLVFLNFWTVFYNLSAVSDVSFDVVSSVDDCVGMDGTVQNSWMGVNGLDDGEDSDINFRVPVIVSVISYDFCSRVGIYPTFYFYANPDPNYDPTL